MYCVYVLRGKPDRSLYVGYTNRLQERFAEHQAGSVFSTKHKRPLELLYAELYRNKKDAMERERYLKTGWGRNYLKKTLKHALSES